jgi:hypothetical protein
VFALYYFAPFMQLVRHVPIGSVAALAVIALWSPLGKAAAVCLINKFGGEKGPELVRAFAESRNKWVKGAVDRARPGSRVDRDDDADEGG